MTAKILPREITSYDLLKSFAIITMIIDHIGIYFFPDIMWFRAIGRLSFPVWLFLIGYAQTRDIPLRLMGGAVILLIVNLLVGGPLLPLNILLTIMAVRLVMDPVMEAAGRSPAAFWRISVLLMIVAIPAGLITEYGTMAILTAMLGYVVRHKQDRFYKSLLLPFMALNAVFYALSQAIVFGLNTEQYLVMGAGVMFIYFGLLSFQPATYPKITLRPLVNLLKLGGRRTLEIYVLHLIVFKIAVLLMGYEDYGFLDFRLF